MKHNNIFAPLAAVVLLAFSSCKVDDGDYYRHTSYDSIVKACDVMVDVCHTQAINLFREVYRLNNYMQLSEEQQRDEIYSDIMYCPSTSTYTIANVGDIFTDDKLITDTGISWSINGKYHYIFTATGSGKWNVSLALDDDGNNDFYPLYGTIVCNAAIELESLDANGNPCIAVNTTGTYTERSSYSMELSSSSMTCNWVKTAASRYYLCNTGLINVHIYKSDRLLNNCSYKYEGSSTPIISK